MMEAILAHPMSRLLTDIPWEVVPAVIGALAALAVVFCGVYKLTGMFAE